MQQLANLGTSTATPFGGLDPAVLARARASLRFDETRLVLDHWSSLTTGDRLPGRRDLRPEEMLPVLGDLWIMDYVRDASRLRYRLVGDEIRSRYDFPLVGKYLDEVVAPGAYPRVAGYFLACTERPAITLLIGRLYHEWQRPGEGERLLLPLFGAEGFAEGLLGITICRRTYGDRSSAEHSSERRMLILPLDGAPVTDETT